MNFLESLTQIPKKKFLQISYKLLIIFLCPSSEDLTKLLMNLLEACCYTRFINFLGSYN
jgi:hypothetical protein